MNLDYTQPFSSTSDLINFTPHLDKNLAIKKELDREQEMKRNLDQANETEVKLDEEFSGFSVKKKSKREDKDEK